MASLNAVVQQLADSINSPFDEMLRARLEDVVISNRALLYRQEFGRTKSFPSYGIFEHFEEALEEDACGVCTGSLVTATLPDLIAVRDDIPFTYVGSTSRKDAISYITPEEIEFFRHNKISKSMPRWTYINKKGYFFNIGTFETILFRGPFADPRKLNQSGCDEGSCFDMDDFSFIEEHLVPTIKIMARQELNIRVEEQEVKVNGEQ